MPVQLSDDLLVSIVQQVKRPRLPHHGDLLIPERHATEDRDTLMRLMSSSKVCLYIHRNKAEAQLCHEASSSLLYKDYLVRDVAKFLKSLTSANTYNEIERLHLYHDWEVAELSYEQIMVSGDWIAWIPRSSPNDGFHFATSRTFTEITETYESGFDMRRLMAQGAPVFQKLKSISLGSLGNRSWNGQLAQVMIAEGLINDDSRIVPHTFLDLPSLDHACQWLNNGPLSLSGRIIKPETPIKIFTFHPRPFRRQCCHTHEQPPVIIGAINRYYFDTASVLPLTLVEPVMEAAMSHALVPIRALLSPSRVNVLHTTLMDPPIDLDLKDVDLDGTAIEIYNCIRIVDELPQTYDPIKAHQLIADLPPQSLETCQKYLDTLIHPKWRGRVKLLNEEDAPPCPSCGFEPKQDLAGSRFWN